MIPRNGRNIYEEHGFKFPWYVWGPLKIYTLHLFRRGTMFCIAMGEDHMFDEHISYRQINYLAWRWVPVSLLLSNGRYYYKDTHSQWRIYVEACGAQTPQIWDFCDYALLNVKSFFFTEVPYFCLCALFYKHRKNSSPTSQEIWLRHCTEYLFSYCCSKPSCIYTIQGYFQYCHFFMLTVDREACRWQRKSVFIVVLAVEGKMPRE